MDEFAPFFDTKGQIKPDRVDDLLVEVISGRYLFSLTDNPQALYASRWPTPQDQDKGRIIYVKMLREAKVQGVPTRDELEARALKDGLFTPNERTEKTSLLQLLERQQRAREKTMSPDQKLQLATEMEISRRRIIQIELAEQEILRHSAERIADEARTNYYISCCTLGGEMLDEPVWQTYEDFQGSSEWGLINDARMAFSRVSQGLPIRVIKALARTSEWRMRWKSARESGTSPFEGSGANWDRNKVNLIYWSDFYDNIYQHPEAPDEETVNNDEMLQQWITTQLQKREQAKAQMPSNRPSPTFIKNGQRHRMTKVGGDQTVRVGTPYKIRV